VYQVNNGTATATATVNITINAAGSPPATTYSFYYEGFYEEGDERHPAGATIVYLDAYGVTQYSYNLYNGECRLITAQTIISHVGAGPCTI